ncbi:hypothetical protein FRB90_002210 [Tulasnella sp. 427]|nr:hypothetical protein FRB90_002210 [Tulasnella sp. 427]
MSTLGNTLQPVPLSRGLKERRKVPELPTEILTIIFHIVLDRRSFRTSHLQALSRLRSISSRWFRIIDDTQTLWAATSCLDPEEHVKLALDKSTGVLLDVYCICCHAKEAYDYASLLLPHAHRWKSLEVKPDKANNIAPLLSAQTPNLRKLVVNPAMAQGAYHSDLLVRVRVRIHLSPPSDSQTNQYLPDGPTLDQLIAVFAACSSTLESLVIAHSVVRRVRKPLAQTVYMPALKSFIITEMKFGHSNWYMNTDYLPELLDVIQLPLSASVRVGVAVEGKQFGSS